MRKKVLVVFGTRPEAIKMAPVIKELKKYDDFFDTKVCITSQHKELLREVLKIFKIKADFDLSLMQENQTLYDITTKILLKIKDILYQFQPDILLVHGDTTTTFATTLASFYQKIDVAHVEAGLRSFDIYSPWPEEANRRLTAVLAKFHFAPTAFAKKNLLKENIKKENIFITGNSVIDAMQLVLKDVKRDKKIAKKFSFLDNSRFILVTAHRRENFFGGIKNICLSLKKLAKKYKDIKVVFPVHPNPNVKNVVFSQLRFQKNIFLLEPLGYKEFIYLMDKCFFILSDSGGVQEEAPTFKKPLLLLRDKTERPEALRIKSLKLVGTNQKKILYESSKLLDVPFFYKKILSKKNPFGDGQASKRIVKVLKDRL